MLVESVSTPKGPRQKVICSLGDLRPRPREAWLRLARRVVAALAGQQELFEGPDPEVEAVVAKVRSRWASQPAADRDVVALRTSEVTVEEAREAGPVQVGYHFWRRLELDRILAEAGLREVSVRVACAMVLNRLIAPRSEHAMPGWMRRTAIYDVVGARVKDVAEDALYRMLDRLHPQRAAIEAALARREQELFGLDGTVFVYDLTSSFFEGQALKNGKARRGYSRDSRPECTQVVVGLVVGREGFPVAHEVVAGNTVDRQSLEPMLDALGARVPLLAGQTVVVDRGMACADNLASIRARGLHRGKRATRASGRGGWPSSTALRGSPSLRARPRRTTPGNARRRCGCCAASGMVRYTSSVAAKLAPPRIGRSGRNRKPGCVRTLPGWPVGWQAAGW